MYDSDLIRTQLFSSVINRRENFNLMHCCSPTTFSCALFRHYLENKWRKNNFWLSMYDNISCYVLILQNWAFCPVLMSAVQWVVKQITIFQLPLFVISIKTVDVKCDFSHRNQNLNDVLISSNSLLARRFLLHLNFIVISRKTKVWF